MNELLALAPLVIEKGLIFSGVVAAVFISTRLINRDNLSIEGAFGLGGALSALCALYGINPFVNLAVSTFVAGLSGTIMGLLMTKARINHIVSGIVVTSGLFSVVLVTVGSNVALAHNPTLFNIVTSPFFGPYKKLIILGILVSGVIALVRWVLKTEVGLLLHAVGDTPQMVINVGKSIDRYTILGMTLSNTLAALSGALFVHDSGYFSIWSSVGVMVIGLAGLILAQTINNEWGWSLVVGSVAYQALISWTFELQLDPNWNKLITAVLIIALIMAKQSLRKEKSC